MSETKTTNDLFTAEGGVTWYDNENHAWFRSSIDGIWRCNSRGLEKPYMRQGWGKEFAPYTTERKNNMATSLTVQRTAQKDAIAQAEEALAKARAALASFTPNEPLGQGAVVRFKKFRHAYHYAAIRVGNRWYVTQDGTRSARQGVAPMTWDELLEWIGDRGWDGIEVLN